MPVLLGGKGISHVGCEEKGPASTLLPPALVAGREERPWILGSSYTLRSEGGVNGGWNGVGFYSRI
jgi:hypothetical protein